MKKVKRWLKDMFHPEIYQDLDISAIAEALTDAGIRGLWLAGVVEELRTINFEVDKRLLSNRDQNLTDLCARRKAYQDILEAILSAKRSAMQEKRHNPRLGVSDINLDRVTV